MVFLNVSEMFVVSATTLVGGHSMHLITLGQQTMFLCCQMRHMHHQELARARVYQDAHKTAALFADVQGTW
jgi:hypothetical protein